MSSFAHQLNFGYPEREYREFYLKGDIKQAKLAFLLFTVPLLGFILNDYQFFGISVMFWSMVALRLILVGVGAVLVVALGKVKNPRVYDKLVFSAISVYVLGGGVISALRPQSFLFQVIITIISLFVLFLVIPLKFQHQFFLSLAAAVGEGAIVVLVIRPPEVTVTFSLLFSLLLAMLIGSFSALSLHRHRKQAYHDYMQRKHMQEALEQYSKNLEKLVAERTEKLQNAERFAAIGELAGMIGHDLRNPLTSIQVAAYYLRKNGIKENNGTAAAMVDNIEKSVSYSNKIITDLLDYSREIKLEPEKTTPKKVMSIISAIVAPPENVKFEDKTQDTPIVKIDADKMSRVLMNLIKNAYDALPNGGTVTVMSRQTENTVEISVQDTGIGMTSETVSHLWKPLFTTKAKGMGFGLPICRRIVEAHGGNIDVESAPHKGTTFTVTLPLN